MSQNNIKLIPISILLSTILFTGCSQVQANKTNTTTKKQTKENKPLNFVKVGETFLSPYGWLDADNILQVDTNSASKCKISSQKYTNLLDTAELTEFNSEQNFQFSPNKNKIYLSGEDSTKEGGTLKDLKSGEEKNTKLSWPIDWSKNSKYYCGMSISNRSENKVTFSIYDMDSNAEKEVDTFYYDKGSTICSISPSDDCKYAILITLSSINIHYENAYLIDISNDTSSFNNTNELQKYKIEENYVRSAYFFDNSTIAFTTTSDNSDSSPYSLYLYDINSKNKKELLSNVSSCAVSPDFKYIVFTNKDSNKLQLAEFNKQSMSISNTHTAYEDESVKKGMISWSPDNKKLICGDQVLQLQK